MLTSNVTQAAILPESASVKSIGLRRTPAIEKAPNSVGTPDTSENYQSDRVD